MRRLNKIILLLAAAHAVGCDPAPTPGTSQPGQDVPDAQAVADVVTSDVANDDVAVGDAASKDGAIEQDAVATDGAVDQDAASKDGAVDQDAAACPTGQQRCGADCVDTSTSAMHCGACGTACAPANANGACVMGACTVGACSAGYADCNGMAADGCEVNLNESADNCGACGAGCAFANATGACRMGACAIGACNAGFSDCDSNSANGCETETASTVSSCGMCGNACSVANATAGCAMGACTVATCNEVYGNCDMNAANGCETALNTNMNCGACGRACMAGTRCASGDCVSSCPTGTTYCDALQICVNLSSDDTNCGACGNACPARANATNACTGGTCRITCSAGYGDCDMDAANGCEANLATTAAHCGACGSACSLPNATAGCAAGACTIASCNAGFGDCDGNPANGCEVNLNATPAACGSCGTACNVPNAAASCAMGRCGVASCNAGFADCDMNAANGCETPTTTNANCGACGAACMAGTRCAGGTCVSSCPTGTTFCPGNGVCADFQTDASNCGMCGTACPSLANASPVCNAGACGFVCNSGFADCDGNPANGCEVNLASNTANCGACGSACRPTNAVGACVTGACQVVACNTGFGDCNGNPADGCEVNLTSTVSSCGTCTNVCRPANGTGACAMGTCGVSACDSGYGNCDMNAANGCETSLNGNANCGACGRACGAGTICSNGVCVSSCPGMTTYCGNVMSCVDPAADPQNCGGCGTTCPVPANAAATCSGSTCGLSCNSGYGNCDNQAGNGCEVNLNTSAANCGACGSACRLANATAACSAGACTVASCALNYGNCDGLGSNGCETNTLTSVSHCGACGNACSYANASATCSGGACALGTCSAGYGNCDRVASNGCETPLDTNTNCGACGTRCGANTVCSRGMCVSNCPAGTTLCNGACVVTTTDPNNCGGCGRVCPSYPRVIRTCMAGTCGGTCESGYGNCDRNTGNGCETNINTNVNHCGACGNACNLANATPVCAAGDCAIGACYPGYANCDRDAANGCEINLMNNNSNCGACGRVCPDRTTCRLGTCR